LEIEGLFEPEVLSSKPYPVVFVFVVDHAEGALREVVEHHAADQLVGFDHRNAQQALFEKRKEFGVVIELVEALADGLLLRLNESLQRFYVIEVGLLERRTLRTIKSSSNSVKSYV
jgi:hypothetical protein